MKATYIIGEPGAGKSTLVDHLTRGLPHETAEQPFAHRYYDCGVFEIGRRRHEFSGTDALAMNVQPEAIRFIEGIRPALLLAEGDRLANEKFFKALVAIGYELTVYVVAGSERAALQRSLRGTGQNAAWVKGRITKNARLAESRRAILIPAGAKLSEMEALMGDPVSMALRNARLVPA